MNQIRVFLRGGLGNQFFQWVYALHLSQQGQAVCLDTHFLRQKSGNQAAGVLELNRLFKDLHLPLFAKYTPTKKGRYFQKLEPLLTRAAAAIGWLENDRPAHAKNRLAPWQYGYYQSADFLTPGLLKQLKTWIHPQMQQAPDPLRDKSYTALHIRAGDYGANRYNFEQIGRLSLSYYVQTFEALSTTLRQNEPLIIVTDDAAFGAQVRDTLRRMAPSQDIDLLSACLSRPESSEDALQTLLNARCLSIANSSFSAMAAWLGKAEKILAPQPWFKGTKLSHMRPVAPDWTALPALFDDTSLLHNHM
jgi:hypothetical protein